jgi:hypothetical protein
MKPIFERVYHSDNKCEHYCIIGMKHYKKGTEQHYVVPIFSNNTINDQDDTHRIEIFNFCPCCGQELNIEPEIEKHEILKFKENK